MDPGEDGPEDGSGPTTGRAVEAHYDRPGLRDRLLSALSGPGIDAGGVDRSDLAGVSEFHLQGRRATRDLAVAAGLDGDLVVDAGGGVGGPARTLAAEYDCRVVAVDRTPSYCRAGAALTRLVGLADRVGHCRAEATRLPVGDRPVDAVWSQHLLPNLPAVDRAVGEFARVLAPGGRLAVHEVFAGPTDPVRYPVPFATDGSVSFLVAPDRFRAAVDRAGFDAVEWTDVSERTVEWYEALFDRTRGDRADEERADDRPPGLELVVGDGFGERTRTMYRNLAEDRLRVFRGVFEFDPSG